MECERKDKERERGGEKEKEREREGGSKASKTLEKAFRNGDITLELALFMSCHGTLALV